VPANSEKVRVAAAHAGAAKRWNPEDTSAARDLAAARIEEVVRRVVADAPPLTADQEARVVAALLKAANRG
jgi:hypothetical protein